MIEMKQTFSCSCESIHPALQVLDSIERKGNSHILRQRWLNIQSGDSLFSVDFRRTKKLDINRLNLDQGPIRTFFNELPQDSRLLSSTILMVGDYDFFQVFLSCVVSNAFNIRQNKSRGNQRSCTGFDWTRFLVFVCRMTGENLNCINIMKYNLF